MARDGRAIEFMEIKKSDQIILQDINSPHSLYDKERKGSGPKKKSTHVLVYPMLDEHVLPYLQLGISSDTEYQTEVLRKASSQQRPIVLVPEAEYAIPGSEDDILTAAQFRNCHGIVAWPIMVTDSDNNHVEAFIHTGFQCHLTTTQWEGDLVTATVVEDPVKLIPWINREVETENILEGRFKAILAFLADEHMKNQIMDRLEIYSAGTQERLSLMMQNSPLDRNTIIELLKEPDLKERRLEFIRLLSLEMDKLALRDELNRQTLDSMNQRQRAEFLRAQIRTFQNELNGDSDFEDEEELRRRAEKKEWNEETANAFKKEMKKLSRYAPNSPEYAMQYAYLDTFLNLPWQHCDNSVFELEDVEKILDRDHHALTKVKERIIEQMAVIKLKDDLKSPILCLAGPPGVGKTSLGKSIAEAIGRKYVRVALGGVHDEAEIRGHRRTYLGSMCGRIISALEKCGTSDPVMVLDEIDKLGADYKGDPQSALLEVLDPEQNSHFHDNYIDHDYDLSKVLFIATANALDPISQPLLDRMEVIDIEGYVEDEKVEIARKHLVPRNLERHGFGVDEVEFTTEAIRETITYYTHESGVRQLEKRIASILRKLARSKASHKDVLKVVTPEDVRTLLGRQTEYPDQCEENSIPGVVVGLAWTRCGGEILFIESSIAPGKDSKLTLTGNLGDVMKESAAIALQYLKAHAEKYGLTQDSFAGKELHIHVPEGAVPKDGPSAGIAMLTSIASAYTGRRVKPNLAMTGELTLRGKVLPVGGIKEKILAAKRAGIKDVVLCEKNRKAIEEIPLEYLEGLTFHFVDSASEVLDFALLPLE